MGARRVERTQGQLTMGGTGISFRSQNKPSLRAHTTAGRGLFSSYTNGAKMGPQDGIGLPGFDRGDWTTWDADCWILDVFRVA